MSDDMKEMLAGAIARHVLTGVAGWLITMGWIGSGDRSSFIQMGTGIVVGAIGFAWSWWQKSGHAALIAKYQAATGKKS